jgi:4'-phosphopantetheinyl transferase
MLHQDLQAPRWAVPPEAPETAPGTIDVWRLARPADRYDDAAGWHAQTHRWMRSVLAGYAGLPVDALEIRTGGTGKPYVASPGAVPRFNLSHCRDLALLAVSGRHEVGIDVETSRPIADPLRLAQRALDPADVALVESAAEPDRTALLLRLWTRFEARQKTLGRGIFAERVDPNAVGCCSFAATERHWASVCIDQTSPPRLRFFARPAIGS